MIKNDDRTEPDIRNSDFEITRVQGQEPPAASVAPVAPKSGPAAVVPRPVSARPPPPSLRPPPPPVRSRPSAGPPPAPPRPASVRPPPPSMRPPPPPTRPGSMRPPPPPSRPASIPPSPRASQSVRPPAASVRPGPSSSPEALAAELAQTQRVLASKLAEVSALSTERSELLARIAERDQRIAERDARLRELPSIIAERDGLKKQVHFLDGRVSELETTQIEVAALRSALREREREIAELSSQAQSASSNDLEKRVAALEAELQGRARKIRELESELQDALAWSAPSTDDLTRIRGIGPSFQKKLAALGIDKFAQIAAWTPARAEEVARALKIAPARITRDGWIESARTLLRGG